MGRSDTKSQTNIPTMKLFLTLGLSSIAVASANNCYDWNADPKGLNYDGFQKEALTSSRYSQYKNKKAECQNWNSSYPNTNDSGFNENHNIPDPRGQCFVSSEADEVFNMPYFTEQNNQSWCKNKCAANGFAFAGAETPKMTMLGKDRVCKCFNSFTQQKSSNCNRWCTDYDQNKFCGGDKAMNVWKA